MAARRRPPLTPAVLADRTALGDALDALLQADPTWRRQTRAVLKAQEQLRAVLDDEQWAMYLDVEAAANARLTEALITIARWAFEEGPASSASPRRAPRHRSRRSR